MTIFNKYLPPVFPTNSNFPLIAKSNVSGGRYQTVSIQYNTDSFCYNFSDINTNTVLF